MRKETLEGRLNAKRTEFMELLKKEGTYLQFNEDKGYMYELVHPVFGCLTKILLSLKSGRVHVHELQKQ